MSESEAPTNEQNTPTPEAPAPEAPTPAPVEPATPAPEAPPTAVAPPPEPAEQPATPAGPKSNAQWGTGRRKSAVARVRLLPGKGKITINNRSLEQFFPCEKDRYAVRASLLATNTEGSFDVFVNVRGGGTTGQSGAIRLGVARALRLLDERHEATLREKGYLTRDARVVERKKYGQRKARRRFQFSKR